MFQEALRKLPLTSFSILRMEAEVVHITDAIEIAKRGIMSTPALALNNTMISQGQIISPDRIQEHLQKLMS
jgi:Thioredoxin domain